MLTDIHGFKMASERIVFPGNERGKKNKKKTRGKDSHCFYQNNNTLRNIPCEILSSDQCNNNVTKHMFLGEFMHLIATLIIL